MSHDVKLPCFIYIGVPSPEELQVQTLRFLNILNGLKHTQAGEDGNTAVLSNIHTELLRSNKRITRIVSGV